MPAVEVALAGLPAVEVALADLPAVQVALADLPTVELALAEMPAVEVARHGSVMDPSPPGRWIGLRPLQGTEEVMRERRGRGDARVREERSLCRHPKP